MARRFLFPAARLAAAAACLALLSCGRAADILREPDVTPVRNALKAAMPVGYAANLTMAAMQGAVIPNVTVLRNGGDTSTGCFLVNITVDSAYPLPGNTRATGYITTAGIIVDNSTAIMAAVFSQINVTAGSFVLSDVSTFPAVYDTDRVSGKRLLNVAFSEQDINAGSDTLLALGITQGQIDAELVKYQTMRSFDSGITLAQNGWLIRVDDGGTLADPRDDRYTAFGGGQYVEVSEGTTEIVQLTMINAAMSPSCRWNPTEGWALWQNMGVDSAGPDIGHVLLTFQASCDGNARVTLATGVYLLANGKDIPLELDK